MGFFTVMLVTVTTISGANIIWRTSPNFKSHSTAFAWLRFISTFSKSMIIMIQLSNGNLQFDNSLLAV
jgi:hypothetical protein